MSVIDDWFSLALGKGLDPDGHYGNQCVDAVDHYGEFIFGVPWPQSVGAVSGARQLLDAAPDAYWIRIDYFHGFVPQRGDVLVYGGDRFNSWGHTAVTEAATGTYIDVMQQDGFGAPLKNVDDGWYSDKPAHRARLAYSQNGTGALKGVLRPRVEKLKSSTIQTQSSTTIPLEDDMALSPEDRQLLQRMHDVTRQFLVDSTQAQHDVTRRYLEGRTQMQHDVTRAYLRDTSQDIADVTREYLADRVKEASPQTIADLVPQDIAQQVIDALAARLGDAK